MFNVLASIESILGSFPFLLFVTISAFILKACLLIILFKRSSQIKSAHRSWFLLVLVLIGSMSADSAWILKLVRTLFVPLLDYRIVIFWIRISWAFVMIQYQALALFIETLIHQNFGLRFRHKFFLTISTIFFIFFLSLAFININCNAPSDRPTIEFTMQQAFTIYSQFILMLTTMLMTFLHLRKAVLPRILQTQTKIIILGLIVPHILADLIQYYPFNFFPTYVTSYYFVVSVSTIFLTVAIFYCSRKIMGLRFLNFTTHVEAPKKFVFVDNFKDVLEQLGRTTSMHELNHITQGFFKNALQIPLRRTILYMRDQVTEQQPNKPNSNKTEAVMETLLNCPNPRIPDFIYESKILIHDEIAFSDFYEKNPERAAILAFMEEINADIVLPIYAKHKMIAYIIVDRNARTEFYSDIERDEMLVFATYLGNIIYLLQNRNLEALIHQEKELQEELYSKHQEITQYKESMRSFLKNNKQKDFGIIFYKNRRFAFGNPIAKELIKVNPNTQDGHPLTQTLKALAKDVEDYKSTRHCFAKDSEGNKLMLYGIPNYEQNNVIIIVYYPEISDIITKQIDLLKDHTQWDYLLYLDTTESGKLINQLVPGSGEHLLNFKIDLLKAALSKKATLLEMAQEDLLPTVELLHHIGLREQLHVLTLQGPEKNFETAVKLFGINPIFGMNHPSSQALLQKLDSMGTLFIQNVQFLSLETQNYLVEFIRYGYYRIFKSDQKMLSNARIMCASNQDLQTLVQAGTFSKELYNELKKSVLTMPSLFALPESELNDLAEGFTEQALKTDAFKNLLELTERDKLKIAHQRPISLQELKTKIQQMLVQKSKKNEIYQETQFDPAYEISDPELIQAARLGKHALRDPRVMALLWNKFKNQNKIATFLGVNRSSVNRRCKDYNLI